MYIKHRLQKKAVEVLLIFLMLCCPLSLWAEAAPATDESAAPYEDAYYYYMRVVQTGEKTEAEPTGTIVLELYACTNDEDAPILEGASFGFCFPSYFGQVLTFTPSPNIIMQRIVPVYRSPDEVLDKDTYHAFSWTRYVAALGSAGDATEDVANWESGSIEAPEETAGHLLIGTYVFSGNGALPASSSIGQLDWLTSTEAQGAVDEMGVELINESIWDDSEKAYIGYYTYEDSEKSGPESVVVFDTPLRLVFNKPEAWKGIFNVQGYDPKKDLVMELYVWNEETGAYGTEAAYRLTIAGEADGMGVCVQTVRFDQGDYMELETGETVTGAELPEGKYEMLIRKQSHVSAHLSGLTIGEQGMERVVFPELEGRMLTLPCGDVTGDGRIRQTDRALIIQPGRYGTRNTGDGLYDLNGDGRVDQKDLAILTAPANYGKNDFSMGFTETTNVGDNGV